jgi:ribonucleoside-triphosphate reductase
MTDTIRSFKLANSFLDKYRGTQPKWGPVGYITYKRTYARPKEDGALEEYFDTCQRVVEGCYDIQKEHCRTLKLPWDNAKAQKSSQEMFTRMWEFKWLPPGRGLWMMGAKHVGKVGSAALNNCFSGDTEVLYEPGAFSYDPQEASAPQIGKLGELVGQCLNVYTDAHTTKLARVESFGEQELFRVNMKVPGRSKYTQSFDVTADHRWILSNGESTTALKIGDRVRTTVADMEVDEQDDLYSRGFCHGLIFGDGTRHTYYPERHSIRLCGDKEQVHVPRLESMPEHLSTTYPASFGGDAVVTLKLHFMENWKQLPKSGSSVKYVRGFVDGWCAADAHTEPSGNLGLDTTNAEAASWICQIAPTVGYSVSGWSLDNKDTNFGPRNKPLNRLILTRSSVELRVESVESLGIQEVYCPVVPDENQFMLSGGVVTGNCGFVSTAGIKTDLADPFTWLMDMLMLGVGVGFDTKGANLVKIQEPKRGDHTHVVEDSREGWVSLLRATILPYSGKGSLPDTIDYSKVRPAGMPIQGFGGTASGPGPLDELIVSIGSILDNRVGDSLSSVDIVDMCNLVGRCVVAGNVRRSAEIAFGEPNDLDFSELKDPKVAGAALEHHRWASNNSIFAKVGMDYSHAAARTAINGEPGYEWLDNARAFGRMGRAPDNKDRRAAGGNPCLEQTLEDRELCCLVETFPSMHDSYEDYEKTLKYAYLYAKSVTLVPTHDERTNTVMQRNRRIGTSMSGIVQAMKRHGTREFFSWCDNGYDYLRKLDEIYSDWLCIRQSIKITSVKPSGTVSLLPGVTPGIHYPHAPFYIRRIRFQSDSPLVELLIAHGHHVERDVYSPNTVCVDFPIAEEYFDRSKDDVSMWEQLELAAQMQQWWVDNQVSVTVTFSPEEAGSIQRALELYETRLKGVSFLPLKDHGYRQAPMETITEEEYNDMISGITPITALDTATHEQTERFCDGDVCVVK